MSRHLANALFLVFLLFFMLLSPWTRADVNFLGILVSVSALMCILSFWYGRSFWQQHWAAFLASFSSPRPSFVVLFFSLPLLAVLVVWLLSAGHTNARLVVLINRLFGSHSPANPAVIIVSLSFLPLSFELFFRCYVQPAFSVLLPDVGHSSWLKPLLVAVLVSLLAALLFLPAGHLPFVLFVFLLHLPFALLYAFFPSALFSIVLSHVLLICTFLLLSLPL